MLRRCISCGKNTEGKLFCPECGSDTKDLKELVEFILELAGVKNDDDKDRYSDMILETVGEYFRVDKLDIDTGIGIRLLAENNKEFVFPRVILDSGVEITDKIDAIKLVIYKQKNHCRYSVEIEFPFSIEEIGGDLNGE